MKRRIFILILGLLFVGAVQAQVFIAEDETNDSRILSQEYGVIPYHGVAHDQENFVPFGEGVVLLAALGGAYLLRKKVRINK